MSSPKHLWSGDWQRDSDAAARERAARLRERPEDEQPPAPEQERPAPTALTARPRPMRPRRARRRRAFPRLTLGRAQKRLVATVAAVALLVVGGAYGLSALIGGSSGSSGPMIASNGPWLGLQMQALANGTVVVASVVPGSPAANAGLRPGDAITQVEGRPVGAPVVVTEAVAALSAGDPIEIQFIRGSSIYTVRPRLTARPASFP